MGNLWLLNFFFEKWYIVKYKFIYGLLKRWRCMGLGVSIFMILKFFILNKV